MFLAARFVNSFADLIFAPTLACGSLWVWRISDASTRQDLLQRNGHARAAGGETPAIRLPPASTYVDSFGPFYLELGLSKQPAITDRSHSLRAKILPRRWLDSHQLLAGTAWKPVPRLLWLHRLAPVLKAEAVQFQLSGLAYPAEAASKDKLLPLKAKTPTGTFWIPVGVSKNHLAASLANQLPSLPVSVGGIIILKNGSALRDISHRVYVYEDRPFNPKRARHNATTQQRCGKRRGHRIVLITSLHQTILTKRSLKILGNHRERFDTANPSD